jgi:hypothetical protein
VLIVRNSMKRLGLSRGLAARLDFLPGMLDENTRRSS